MTSGPRKCEVGDVLDSLERVSEAIMGACSSEEMLANVLDRMLDIFDCDRAWLLYPCSVDSPTWAIPMERTRPEWPGAGVGPEVDLPMTEEVLQVTRRCLASDGPVPFDSLHPPIEGRKEIHTAFHIRSELLMAVRPLGDAPWLLGIHHCAEERIYEQDAIDLFRAVGRRFADALTAWVATRELRRSEERFRTLVEHAPEAIVIYDVDSGEFVDANPEACKLFGLSREGLLSSGGPIALSVDVQADGRPAATSARVQIEAAMSGEIPIFEWLHETAQGEPVPCEVRLARLPHPKQKLVRASITDISERKKAEAERAALELRLRQSQKMEAIGQLTGGIAHDFNNLLAVILGSLELIDELVDQPEEVLSLAESMRGAASRAADLTHRLLAFASRQPLQPEVVEIARLVESMNDLLERTLGESVQVAVRLEDELWNCRIDPGQLESSILNLAINARDAMSGDGRLTIAARNCRLTPERVLGQKQVSAGEYVLLSVTDTGGGMDEDVLGQIFAPFFTTKDVGKGSGLGLSMVYGFVKQSKGHIEVESAVGEGTTVRLYLPRCSEEAAAPSAPVSPPSALPSKGETILVVDDDRQLRTLTRRLLAQLGYSVVEAGDGASALAQLEATPGIDLLLTDVVLPGGMNGVELARAARERRPDLRVLHMSGYTGEAAEEANGFAPDLDLIAKPFTVRDLAARLRSATNTGT